MVHLIGFVYDHVAVKFTAFRIFADPFLQALRVSLDQCDGCFQLMGYISQELRPHGFYFFLLFNILLQLMVRFFQLGYGVLQLPGHDVEALAQHTDLVIAASRISGVKIQIRHPLGQCGQLQDRIRDLLGKEPDKPGSEHQRHDPHIRQKFIGQRRAVPDAVQRASKQKQCAVGQLSKHFQVKRILIHRVSGSVKRILFCLIQHLRHIISRDVAKHLSLQHFLGLDGKQDIVQRILAGVLEDQHGNICALTFSVDLFLLLFLGQASCRHSRIDHLIHLDHIRLFMKDIILSQENRIYKKDHCQEHCDQSDKYHHKLPFD